MDLTDLHVFWYVLLGVLVTGYAILDGFDLGVGILHPLVKGDRERRLVLNSIGPLWDGNEVWLVTFGGALFAAFPRAYASLFSAFYLPFMVLLFALIGRAVSIEFRSKVKAPAWRTYWDHSFAFSSLMVVLLFGVAAGNLMQGLPLDANGDLVGDVRDLLRPYPFAVGVLAVITAALHGSLYLHLKTEGALQERIAKLRWPLFGAFLVAYLGVTIATLVLVPHATTNFDRFPVAWVVVVLNVLAVANVPRAIHHGKPGQAFLSSCALIAALVFLFGMAMFPKLALSSLDPAYDLDAWNAASSESTLGLMRWIALLGMPFVLTYTAIVYWVFRGKTKLDDFSY
ncbi:MAG: cytochrome d ubiquinol oxidase subunit II [Sandaracinus sp.]|nr:cytochrome d ubiquinol oxidase subunit II [Sandaracinus sp.]MCB9619890.1 cytochrome d ubiquinol oxidase subunit II [Sandaracinus sp.]